MPISSRQNGLRICRIVVFGTSGYAKAVDISLKKRSAYRGNRAVLIKASAPASAASRYSPQIRRASVYD